MFDKEILPAIEIKQVNSSKGRYYETPAGNFRSVTTILGQFYGTKGLDEWRKRVGKEEADAIANRAARQGTIVHGMLEHYLLHGPMNEKVIPIFYVLYLRYKEFLDRALTKIYGIEHALYSKELKSAGTCDLIGRFYDHYNAITDYKTVRRIPSLSSEQVQKYHIQMTAYAIMVEELYQRDIPYTLVLMASQEENKVVPHIVRNNKYRDKVRSIFASVR